MATSCRGIGRRSYRAAWPGGYDHCSYCGRSVRVRADGTVGKHDMPKRIPQIADLGYWC